MDLVERVIKQIKNDLNVSDETAIESLLTFVPRKNLIWFLNEEEINEIVELKDRQDVITELIDDSIDTVINAHNNNDTGYIDSIFREGFEGFNNMTDEDLEKRYNEIFEVEILITDKE